MIANKYAYRYETPYNVLFLITQCWTSGTVTLHCGAIKIMHNIRHSKPYTYDKNVEDINTENIYDDVNILSPVIYLYIILKIG